MTTKFKKLIFSLLLICFTLHKPIYLADMVSEENNTEAYNGSEFLWEDQLLPEDDDKKNSSQQKTSKKKSSLSKIICVCGGLLFACTTGGAVIWGLCKNRSGQAPFQTTVGLEELPRKNRSGLAPLQTTVGLEELPRKNRSGLAPLQTTVGLEELPRKNRSGLAPLQTTVGLEELPRKNRSGLAPFQTTVGLEELPQPDPQVLRNMYSQIVEKLNYKDNDTEIMRRTLMFARLERIVYSKKSPKDKILEIVTHPSTGLNISLHLNNYGPNDILAMDDGAVNEGLYKNIEESLVLLQKAYGYFGVDGVIKKFEKSGGICFNGMLSFFKDEYLIEAHPEMLMFTPNLSVKDNAAQRFYQLFPVFLSVLAKSLLAPGQEPNIENINTIKMGEEIANIISIKAFLEWGINGYISYTKSNGSKEVFKPVLITREPFDVKIATTEAFKHFNLSGYEIDEGLNKEHPDKLDDIKIIQALGIKIQ